MTEALRAATHEAAPIFEVCALDNGHDRANFSCGVPALDHYFQHSVSQDVRRNVTSCFVARTRADQKIAGYYTLSAASIRLEDLPLSVLKKLPRYPSVPAIRMGRLAVDTHYKGQKLGATLLLNALRRTARSDIAAYAFLVDAKDPSAARFYEHHGFQVLPEQPLALFFPLANCP